MFRPQRPVDMSKLNTGDPMAAFQAMQVFNLEPFQEHFPVLFLYIFLKRLFCSYIYS